MCGIVVKPTEDQDGGVWEFIVRVTHPDGKQSPPIHKKVNIVLA